MSVMFICRFKIKKIFSLKRKHITAWRRSLVVHWSQSLYYLNWINLYTVKNSNDIVEKHNHIVLKDYTTLSIDVKTPFTNVSIEREFDCSEKKSHEFFYSSIEIEEILYLTHFCVRQTAFMFRDNFISIVRILEWEVHSLTCFVILIWSILTKNSSDWFM